jgi:hypothetical protein
MNQTAYSLANAILKDIYSTREPSLELIWQLLPIAIGEGQKIKVAICSNYICSKRVAGHVLEIHTRKKEYMTALTAPNTKRFTIELIATTDVTDTERERAMTALTKKLNKLMQSKT